MSLLSTPTARPERVFSLVSLVRTLGGRVRQSDAKEWLAPTYRTAESTVLKEGERVREIFRVARDLRLLDADRDDWVSVCELPTTKRQFARHVHRYLRELPKDDPDAVLLRAYAWCVVFIEQFGMANLLDKTAKEMASEISGALGRPDDNDDDKVFNSTKLSAWKDWMACLGLGWNDLPGTTGFLPDPSRRIAENLATLTSSQPRVGGETFMTAISKELPYLDGGVLFREACDTRGIHPPKGQVSRLLSNSLRTLDGEGVLKLDIEGDTKKGVALFKDPLSTRQFFSHLDFTQADYHA